MVSRCVRKCMVGKICLVVHYNGQGYIQYVYIHDALMAQDAAW